MAFLSPLLWIAFKNWYLWRYKQHVGWTRLLIACCELLSRIGIFDVINNIDIDEEGNELVVNCFQELVSLTL